MNMKHSTLKNKITRKNILTISIHVLVWSLFVSIPYIVMDIPIESTFFQYKIVETFVYMIVFYTNAYILVPKLVFAKKYILYAIIAGSIIIGGMHISKLILPPPPPSIESTEGTNKRAEYKSRNRNNQFSQKRHKRALERRANATALMLLIVLSASVGYRYALLSRKLEKSMKELKHAHLQSEFELLKSQINPHFLFNTLNSIYSLSIKKSEKTPQALLQLSDMLRYMTYDTTENFVKIKKELAYITNYIALQSLRVDESSTIDYKLKGDDNEAYIAPMILQPFVENIFKHGLSHEGRISATISITITNDIIELYATNKKFLPTTDSRKGIGIENVKQRLEHLYPHKHTLEIHSTEEKYTVQLTIKHT